MVRWEGMEILETLEELVEPKHTALLMWDFAKHITPNSFSYESLITNTARLVAAGRKHGIPILYSRQNNMRWEDLGPPMLRMRMKQLQVTDPAIFKQQMAKHPAQWDFVDQVKPQAEDIIFEKFVPNAFLGTCFEWWLRKHSIKTILLTGVALETGIDGTARDAVNLGYYTVIIRDCVGSRSEQNYNAAMASMNRIFDVLDSSEIIATWSQMST